MPVTAIKLNIKIPTASVPPGRGFYQLEEETLYLPVEYPGEQCRFFSYLESDPVSFQLDRDGRLIFIEITLPRRRWRIKPNLVPPETAESADIRFLDFRDRFTEPAVLCNEKKDFLLVRFSRGAATHNYYLAQNLIAQVTENHQLTALWVFDIVDDLAGREIAAWRKLIHGKPSSFRKGAAVPANTPNI
ncbi:MAG: hypothetical protein JW763_03260 [candidate division Zixibacteria bacterium]|nr:hypothetical protein [candidate division Zixibacteria bacterium]